MMDGSFGHQEAGCDKECQQTNLEQGQYILNPAAQSQAMAVDQGDQQHNDNGSYNRRGNLYMKLVSLGKKGAWSAYWEVDSLGNGVKFWVSIFGTDV